MADNGRADNGRQDNWTQACWDNYRGLWLAEQTWLEQAVADVVSGRTVGGPRDAAPKMDKESLRERYSVSNGIAVVNVSGPMQKQDSKYGGTSTLATRAILRDTRARDDVKGVMLSIDSPGGLHSGTDELASEVGATAREMPVHAHVEGLGASAAYWVGSQASRLTATRTSRVGSIGSILYLVDQSGQLAAEGIRVYKVASGPLKGAGDGLTGVTEAELEYAESIVAEATAPFYEAVQAGRGLSDDELAEVISGETFSADTARDRGLVDGVEGFDAAMSALAKELRGRGREQAARSRSRRVTGA